MRNANGSESLSYRPCFTSPRCHEHKDADDFELTEKKSRQQFGSVVNSNDVSIACVCLFTMYTECTVGTYMKTIHCMGSHQLRAPEWKSVALNQSWAAPSTVSQATDSLGCLLQLVAGLSFMFRGDSTRQRAKTTYRYCFMHVLCMHTNHIFEIMLLCNQYMYV